MKFQVVKKLKHFTSVFLALVMVLSVAVMPSVSVYAYEPGEIGDVVYEMGYEESYGYEVDEEVVVDEPWYVEDDDVLDEPWYGVGDEDEYLDDEDEMEDDFTYIGITPFIAVRISMTTDADALGGEVEANDEIEVTVRWTSVLTATNPVTINVTNGASILINYVDCVEFSSGGVPRPISDLVVATDNDMVTFNSGPQTSGSFQNQVVFSIRAPMGADSFNLSVKVV